MNNNDDGASGANNETGSIRDDFNELEKKVIARETSTLRALMTLVTEWRAYKNGEKAFPEHALIGLAGAYLTPRLIFVLGSVAAIIFTAMQAWMLYRQNELIEFQNEYILSQTRANSLEAVSTSLIGIETENYQDWKKSLLVEFIQQAYPTLNFISRGGGQSGGNAMDVLVRGSGKLSDVQLLELFDIIIIKATASLRGISGITLFHDGPAEPINHEIHARHFISLYRALAISTVNPTRNNTIAYIGADRSRLEYFEYYQALLRVILPKNCWTNK